MQIANKFVFIVKVYTYYFIINLLLASPLGVEILAKYTPAANLDTFTVVSVLLG